MNMWKWNTYEKISKIVTKGLENIMFLSETKLKDFLISTRYKTNQVDTSSGLYEIKCNECVK